MTTFYFQAGAVPGIYHIAETRLCGPRSTYVVIIPSDSPTFFMFPIAGLIADLGLLILSFVTTVALGKYVLSLRKCMCQVDPCRTKLPAFSTR